MNPFLDIPYYPDFTEMTPEAADEALQKLLPETEAAIDWLETDAKPTWDGLMRPLYDTLYPLGDAWGMVGHLLSVMNSDAWRAVQEKHLPAVVELFLRVNQSPVFYRAFCALRDRDENLLHTLTAVQRRLLAKSIQDAEHTGVALEGEAKNRFNEIARRLAKLSTYFRNHLLDSTKAFSLTLTRREEVDGLPESLLAVAAQAAGGTTEEGPWKITLDFAVYSPFMKYSRNASAREQVYRAYVTRASSGEQDNTPLIEEILALCREKAALLGYPNYAALNLSSKMAKTVSEVDKLISQLADASRDMAKREAETLREFVEKSGDLAQELPLTPWNIAFWVERQREAKYDYNDEELSKYFQLPKVLAGLFSLSERLFGIHITEKTGMVPVWHPDVRFFEVYDAGAEKSPIACFYLDPYSRPETKSGGAWMNEFRTRDRRPDGTLVLPMAVLVCNQSVPVGDKPARMRFSEVETLFHEFGHGLQHMLTTEEIPSASGLNGIEWDAVEVASQFMENWCYDRATLQGLSAHVETGEPLPDELFDKLWAAKNYRAATAMMRQLNFAAVDMDLYARYPRPEWKDANAVKEADDAKYSTIPTIPEDRFLNSFSHIFGGGYAAGYYSYKWSEVISADAFAAFEEAGLDDEDAVRAIGRRYRETILALGGGVDPERVFKLFRGRAPRIQAILRHSGLI
ncbi:MAG: M3 family metallopeptidase [Kiritimatiellae bacterium]|nr:M3 family metallopeptidase [Kiritimatiellia bacterium]